MKVYRASKNEQSPDITQYRMLVDVNKSTDKKIIKRLSNKYLMLIRFV